jgi:hypothetical protein
MVGIAIFMFVLAALLIFFGLHPKLSFYLDEGWKFGDETEPSDAYIGISTVGRLLAGGIAFVFGLIVLVSAIGDHHTDTSPTSVPPTPDYAWPTVYPMPSGTTSPSPTPQQPAPYN